MRLILSLLMLLLMAKATAAEPLRVSWGSHNAPPFALIEREQLKGGVIFDIGTALAAKLGTTATFVDVPRARYEAQLRGGRIDVTCITNPKWLADPGALAWSPPLFEESDVFVQQAGTAPWTSTSDLPGRRIGTIYSYVYPSLEPLFASGRMQRDDAATLDGNMRRLVLRRVDAVVDSEMAIRWWIRGNDMRGLFTMAQIPVSTHDSHCAISPLVKQGAGTVRAAFESLKSDGTIERILMRYRGAD